MNIRIFVILIGLFLLSCFKSCQEVNYALWGKKTDAVITSIPRNTGKYGRPLNTFTVTYAATVPDAEDGRIIGGYIVDENEKNNFNVNDTINIVYVKSLGRYNSRYVKDSNTWYILITVAFFSAFAFIGYRLWKQADEDVKYSKK